MYFSENYITKTTKAWFLPPEASFFEHEAYLDRFLVHSGLNGLSGNPLAFVFWFTGNHAIIEDAGHLLVHNYTADPEAFLRPGFRAHLKAVLDLRGVSSNHSGSIYGVRGTLHGYDTSQWDTRVLQLLSECFNPRQIHYTAPWGLSELMELSGPMIHTKR